jgi:VIT1/CCC1 family predicted Fe2+/Mn2+ transporter
MFYLIGARFGRNVRLNLARRVQNARDHESALALIEAEVDLDASVLTDARDRAALRTLLLRTLKRANAAPRRNTSDEMLAAGIVCGLVTGAALPGVLPLLLLDDVTTAIGVANGLQIALLVWVGYRWAGFAGAPRWRTGLAVAATASGLVAIAVALGG